MNSVRTEEIETLTILNLRIQRFDVWLDSIYEIAEDSPEGFTVAEVTSSQLLFILRPKDAASMPLVMYLQM